MATPLYAQVARKLSAAIASGRFPVGSLLPTELELCDQYGTSPEFERDLRYCLEAHSIPADHAPDHPASAPLAECVADVYETHAGGAK